jgi:uncharacterized membrane protein (DUF106 family)
MEQMVKEELEIVKAELGEVKEKIKKAEDAGDRGILFRLIDKENELLKEKTMLLSAAHFSHPAISF